NRAVRSDSDAGLIAAPCSRNTFLAVNANCRTLLHAFSVEVSKHHVRLFRIVIDPGDVERSVGRRSRRGFRSVDAVCRNLERLWFIDFRALTCGLMFTAGQQEQCSQEY